MNSLKNSCINYDGKTLHEIFHENTALSKENIGVFSHYIGTAMESGNVKIIMKELISPTIAIGVLMKLNW